MDLYDEWNIVKKRIGYGNHTPPYFKEGDIWWLSVGYNIGNEVYGKGNLFARPILIFKKFSRNLFLGIPLSSKIKRNPYYLTITVKNKKNSLLLSQIRAFSSLRMKNKMGEISNDDFMKAKKSVGEVLK